MDFTLDNAVSTYYATLGHQDGFWNLYSVVAFGLLAYLGTSKTQSSLIRVCISSFVFFSFINLSVICSLQSNLITITTGITAYVNENSTEVPSQFREILLRLPAHPLYLVVVLHVLATIGFSIAMFFAGNISPNNSSVKDGP